MMLRKHKVTTHESAEEREAKLVKLRHAVDVTDKENRN